MIDTELLGDCKKTWFATHPDGYSQTKFDGTHLLHHRLEWCLARGLHPNEIKGLVVRHKCDNPSCVNVTHLEIGSQKDNMQDKVKRGRLDFRGGEHNPASKLTPENVRQIRARSREPQKKLADEFGVTISAISGIISRRTWRHLD